MGLTLAQFTALVPRSGRAAVSQRWPLETSTGQRYVSGMHVIEELVATPSGISLLQPGSHLWESKGARDGQGWLSLENPQLTGFTMSFRATTERWFPVGRVIHSIIWESWP